MTWAVVLCRFQDVPQETATAAFFQNYFTVTGAGTQGAFDYWRDISGGRFVNNSQVFGWFVIPHNSAEIAGGILHRSVYQQWAVDAAVAHGVPLNNFPRRVFFFNADGDHGAAGGGTTVFSYRPGRALEPTFIAHEMGHTLGLGHSFSDAAAPCCGGGQAGEYCDGWDVMSAMCVFGFPGAHGGSGPGLSTAHLEKMGWLDSSRVFKTWTTGNAAMELDLVPMNQPQLPGFLAARVDVAHMPGSNVPGSYFVEFRTQSGWDQGVPNAAVLIHSLENGRSTLLGSGRANRPNLDWKVGDTFDHHTPEPFSISVVSIDAANQRARIRVTRHGLSPVWMLKGRIEGAGMHWSRGRDMCLAADVDGDARDEILIANNQNGYIGLLKWNGSALTPTWIGSGRIAGTGMHWSRDAADQIIVANVDSDTHDEFLITNNKNGYIGLLKWTGAALAPIWIGSGQIQGAGMHWSRGAEDEVIAADVDNDGHDEFLIANNANGYIGLLKWNGSALAPIWIGSGRLEGAGMHWTRGAGDAIIAADVDGDGVDEFVIANNQNGYVGILKWNGTALVPVWIVAGRIEGAGMHWSRGIDLFVAADVDGDGHVEVLVSNLVSNWMGVLKWDGSALKAIWVQPIDSLAGPAFRGSITFLPADVDKTKSQSILIPNGNGWTGLFKWNGTALAQGWFSNSPLAGGAGSWIRAVPDQFVAADLDGDGRSDFVVANNDNGWIGAIRWDAVP